MRPFDLLRSELMTLLHQTFKDYLQPPTVKPLHEIFFFTATATVRRHLVGAPRAALHTALTDPYLYLEHPDLEIQDQGEIPPTLPDICVGYKLHLECPRLINVYDWLSCWHSIISTGAESISEEEQARFARIVSELQYIGFIKSSTRKTDHVARLTFGGS
ncbi:origin recognition complex subunit 3-like [Eurytemora carolleeae]|uniref:origin recognition complex subunit 3-like n=1 Tax=Eurytemora carolleeae TaxID=1294199 RepID=UPI000C762F2B|nr:origin recognition complex subunit 3-like [Eurytemora carolleeae]|eukprot:XP_023347361.1 origin recognition complex subunit 3-like [Eurytemora affinis]